MREFRTRLLLAGSIAASLPGVAVAQALPPTPDAQRENGVEPAEEVEEPGALQTITVTARKRSEDLQKAAATITVVDGPALTNQGIDDVQSLERVLPSTNLRVQGAVTQTFIRGVGTRIDNPNFANASAFLLNGVILPRYATSGLLFDIDTVQAIAGPQGTLYGGSAAGGAINLNSNAAQNDYSGNAAIEYGNYDALQLSAVQNLALGPDISMRGALDYKKRDAYYSAGLNSQDAFAGRLSLSIQPTDTLRAQIFYTAVRDRGEPTTTLVGNPFDFPDDPYRVPETGVQGNPIDASLTFQDIRNDIISGLITLDVGDSTFTYIPGYLHSRTEYEYFLGRLGNRHHPRQHERQISQELRWHLKAGRFDLDAGLFYLRNQFNYDAYGVVATSADTYVNVPRSDIGSTDTTYAIFGQSTYWLTDQLRFTAGLRVTNDKVDASGSSTSGGVTTPFTYRRSQTTPDFKLGVDFDLTPRILLYSNFQTGYVRFGYNHTEVPLREVVRSRLHAYSAGIKSRFADNRLEANAEAFYYSYDNFQAVHRDSATGQATVAQADSTIYGLDASVRASLPWQVEAGVNAVLLNATYDTFHRFPELNGNTMVNAPKLNLTGYLQKTFPIGRDSIIARAGSAYESGHHGSFDNGPRGFQERYTRTDLSLEYQTDRWSILAFVRNVEDKAIYGNLNSRGEGSLLAPRTYGVRATLRWY